MAENNGSESSNGKNVGRVESVTGVVVDAVFDDELPGIYSALEIQLTAGAAERDADEATTLVCEVQQHLGDDRVRAVAMDATDGLKRGDEVVDTGGPITVPVGDATLGRIFNLLGDPIDNAGPVEAETRWPIHRPAPEVEDLTPTQEVLETGDQGRRPARAVREGRQGRPVRRCRGRQDGADPGADPQHR